MKIIYRLLFIVFAAMGAVSCGAFTEIAKSGDSEMIYDSAFDYYEEGKLSKASQLFNIATPYYVGTQRADTIAYYIGLCSYKSGDFDASSAAFDDFRQRFSRSPFLEDAEYMYAKGFYYGSPDIQKDQTWTKMAIYNINEYLERYPNSVKKEVLNDNLKELQDKLYQKSFANAYTYYKIKRYKSAITAFNNALTEYPSTTYREEILYHIVKSGYQLAKYSYEELQRDRYLNVLDYYYNFVAEFPNSKHKKEVDRYEAISQTYLRRFDKKDDTETEKTEE